MGFCWNPGCNLKINKHHIKGVSESHKETTKDVSVKYMCSICNVPRYCSKKCQTSDWDYHKQFCAKDYEERVLKMMKENTNFFKSGCISQNILTTMWFGRRASLFSDTQGIPASFFRCVVCTTRDFPREVLRVSSTQYAYVCIKCKHIKICRHCKVPHLFTWRCPRVRRFHTFILCQLKMGYQFPKDILKVIWSLRTMRRVRLDPYSDTRIDPFGSYNHLLF